MYFPQFSSRFFRLSVISIEPEPINKQMKSLLLNAAVTPHLSFPLSAVRCVWFIDSCLMTVCRALLLRELGYSPTERLDKSDRSNRANKPGQLPLCGRSAPPPPHRSSLRTACSSSSNVEQTLSSPVDETWSCCKDVCVSRSLESLETGPWSNETLRGEVGCWFHLFFFHWTEPGSVQWNSPTSISAFYFIWFHLDDRRLMLMPTFSSWGTIHFFSL